MADDQLEAVGHPATARDVLADCTAVGIYPEGLGGPALDLQTGKDVQPTADQRAAIGRLMGDPGQRVYLEAPRTQPRLHRARSTCGGRRRPGLRRTRSATRAGPGGDDPGGGDPPGERHLATAWRACGGQQHGGALPYHGVVA